jgi:glycosyltransferase involved in cell wall biosynthesis
VKHLRVVIAVPAFNEAATIGETLDALQENDALGKVAFVVLLNDFSSDDTAAVAQKHWRCKVPFEIWENHENVGERRTTNRAMKRLVDVADWTFILHADDLVKPNWISLYLGEIEKVPSTVASICSSYDVWWPSSNEITLGEEFPDQTAVHVPGEREHVLGTLDKGCWWHLSGCGLRNEAFIAIGGFKPDMPQLGDWEWLLRCLASGYGIWYLPRSTMLYRQHSKSISSRSFREGRDLGERICILQTLRNQGFLSESEYASRVRHLIGVMARRTTIRAVRGDAYGFRRHASVLFQTGISYMRGRI